MWREVKERGTGGNWSLKGSRVGVGVGVGLHALTSGVNCRPEES